MVEDSDLRRDLLGRIDARRAGVQAFLRNQRPRTRRRSTVMLVLSSLAALFTAGPAVGGTTFAEGVQKVLNLPSDSYVWRVLCLLAMLVSVGAAVLTNISKSQDDVARLSTAEAANAELEGLTNLVQFGQLTVPDAVKLYQQYSVKIPFVDDQSPGSPAYGAPPPQGPGYYVAPPQGPGYYVAPPKGPGPYPPPPPHG
jgi:type II secretory pathway pseudopilin PulG